MAPSPVSQEQAEAKVHDVGALGPWWRPVSLPTDFDYVPPDDEPDPDFQCCVCLGWPVDPVILGCPAGHMLCRRCVTGSLCPLDRQPFARVSPVQRPIQAILDRLQVRCPKAQQGCDWKGPRGDLPHHCSQCLYTVFECLRCGLLLPRSRWQELTAHQHEDWECSATAGTAATETSSCQPVSTPPPSASAAESRMERISRIIQVYEQAERLNVCFVVDCTGSMGSHIRAVRSQIQLIVHELAARLPSMQLQLSFVGYRDHCDGEPHVFSLPFSNSVDGFKEYVASVTARGGGGDGPEDVHGALKLASELDWTAGGAATRVLIHIADYPAHGRTYNDCPDDFYPAGDPSGLCLEDIIGKLRGLSVQYIFGHITPHTQKMVRVLNESFPNYIESKEMGDVSVVSEVVTASLRSSVASTVSTLLGSESAETVDITMSDEVPDWAGVPSDTVRVQTCKLVEDVSALQPGSEVYLTRLISTSAESIEVQLAPYPFAQGETRVARHAMMNSTAAVAKHFKAAVEEEDDDDSGEMLLESLFTLSEVSAVACFLAEKFSESQPDGERIRFLPSSVAAGHNIVAFNVEDALPADDFQRFSNNIGWWEAEAPKPLLLFTKFTYEVTNRHMMVVDLQGVKVESGWVLTDPCILCEDTSRFGDGNLGPQAMDRCIASATRLLEPPPPTVAVEASTSSPASGRVSRDVVSRDVTGVAWRPPRTDPTRPDDVNLHVDDVIAQLVDLRKSRPGTRLVLPEDQIRALITVARDVFERQPMLLELEAPMKILGDIHGQFHDLLRLLEVGGPPPTANYLMLGDFVDRGRQSIETICLLLAYKVKYPENFFMLRGNHECASINRIYGFYDECKSRYNIKLWKMFTSVFNVLPVSAVIDDKILCMHGGISPELQSLEQIKNIPRPTDVPDTGLLCDLLWSDPTPDAYDWTENDRGVSFAFGESALKRVQEKLELDLIVRAHQVVEDGYEFFAGRRLVTVFSAPNYGGSFDNAAALLDIDDTLQCSFKIIAADLSS
mmetsp:Transcript_2430/g.5202  ORF Transcript_2430/g.5202 Transcript_2430/m.5202 type:complete len:1015 (-) Transcript_2430:195-3239(-)|eukprot:CAMPEP_0178419040 /NCGR_PEP_ID=MMETSP0689_2-20121128/25400_1 /TAXON_ID=160604 /ORGANISM="Amphidinium massartii, Strain CS-259" /LENGTH=1014 /DNA_ID=CAMNT_0020040455 /DNA_START=66 /DNA_END=3110 /DNA_ORIENTATION=+